LGGGQGRGHRGLDTGFGGLRDHDGLRWVGVT
jgi:hypothetical protein